MFRFLITTLCQCLIYQKLNNAVPWFLRRVVHKERDGTLEEALSSEGVEELRVVGGIQWLAAADMHLGEDERLVVAVLELDSFAGNHLPSV